MELVDDHYVERIRGDVLEPPLAERLDHREYVPALRDAAAAVDLAEISPLQDRAVRR